MNYIFYVCFLLFFVGCGIKKPVLIDNFQEREILAKYADLPDAPFQVKLQSIETLPDEHNHVQLFYTTMMPVDELVDFYRQQMERCGWELLAESHVQDRLLYYIKPTQICSILISEHKLTIYLCKKGA